MALDVGAIFGVIMLGLAIVVALRLTRRASDSHGGSELDRLRALESKLYAYAADRRDTSPECEYIASEIDLSRTNREE